MICSLNLISHRFPKGQGGERGTLKQGLSLPKDPASSLLCVSDLCGCIFLSVEKWGGGEGELHTGEMGNEVRNLICVFFDKLTAGCPR